MIIFPNAKINLGLHVLSRRIDGYHNIETLMIETGLSDILEFTQARDDKTELVASGRPVHGEPGQNLVVKAWDLLHMKYGIPAVKIHLHKIIPPGSGLGGGSSDAAFMLKGLNDYFGLDLTPARLSLLASALGSDCAFFIDNKPAVIEGRGNILTPSPRFIQNHWLYIFYPGLHVSTTEAYKKITPDISRRSIIDILFSPINHWKDQLVNDFEKFAFNKYPLIGEIKQNAYKSGAVYAAMSGSGSALFGIFREKTQFDDPLKKWIIWEEFVKG